MEQGAAFQPWHPANSVRPAQRLALDSFSFAKVPTEKTVIMQSQGTLEVEPQPFRAQRIAPSVGGELNVLPAAKGLRVELGEVAGDHHPARQLLQDSQQLTMLSVRHLEFVEIASHAGFVHVRRIAIDELRAAEFVSAEEGERVRSLESPDRAMMASIAVFCDEDVPIARTNDSAGMLAHSGDNGRVKIKADVQFCGLLQAHDRAAAEKGFDVGFVRRHQVDDRLIDACAVLSAWISHSPEHRSKWR